MTKYKIDSMLGKRYGRLKIKAYSHNETSPSGVQRRVWLCDCDCGNTSLVATSNLTRVKSCGCLRNEISRAQPTGEQSKSWKGGKIIDGGYVRVYLKNHPKASKNGYVREHIVVMEKKLGRPLVKGENVHHINGDKTDNRPSNLELWNTSQPAGQRIQDKLDWAREIIRLYG